MPYHIVKHGDQYCVEKKDSSKSFGCHGTKEEATAQLRALYANEPKAAEVREYYLRTAGAAPRAMMLHGRPHLAVPAVALVEGVIHAVNAETPEYVTREFLAMAAASWNGRPIVVGHPTRGNVQVSANTPGDLEQRGCGTIFNSDVKNNKLSQELWFDVARLEALGQHELLADIRAGRPIEVSVGANVRCVPDEGTFNGKPYKAKWLAGMGDHLAVLPGGRGACSVEMGCGACRAAEAAPTYEFSEQEPTMTDGKGLKVRSLRERLTALVTAIRAGAPFDTPEQAASEEAAELVGYNALRTHLDAMGKAWDEASGIVDDLIADETENPTQTPAQEEAEEEIETARLDVLQSLLSAMNASAWAMQSVCMNLCQPDETAPRYMEATDEQRAAIGKAISARNMKVIQAAHDNAHAMHDSTTNLGAACTGMRVLESKDEDNLLSDRGTDGVTGGTTMTAEERKATIKALTDCGCSGWTADDLRTLEAMTDPQLERQKAKADAASKANADLKAAQDKALEAEGKLRAAEAKIAEQKPVELTEDQVRKAFPRMAAMADRAAAEEKKRKTELVEKLKAAQSVYDEEALNGFDLPRLEEIGALVKLSTPAADYSGRGLAAPRTEDKQEDYTPPDPYEAGLKALAASKAVN